MCKSPSPERICISAFNRRMMFEEINRPMPALFFCVYGSFKAKVPETCGFIASLMASSCDSCPGYVCSMCFFIPIPQSAIMKCISLCVWYQVNCAIEGVLVVLFFIFAMFFPCSSVL